MLLAKQTLAAMIGLRRDQQLMPGSFGPEDYIDFYDNPFETLDEIQTTWKEREPPVSWSAKNLQEIDVADIDWHKYDPPAALRKTPNITSQVLLDILWTSLENVKASSLEEDRQKQEAEEQRRLTEEDKGKGKEPYLPIIIPTDTSAQPDTTPLVSTIGQIGSPVTTTTPEAITKAKANKKRLFALRRLFQRKHEKGESSATGAALEALREQVESPGPFSSRFGLLTKPNPEGEV